MQKPTVESEHLYQSLWWTRLAAFSEKRESPAANTRRIEEKRSSFRRALASLFCGFHFNQERGHARFLPLSGIKYYQESMSAHL